ncbi:MAG: hypothetical protein J0L84_18230 [Verrucomicrobia bacterium]|nr:hypothetical protein [Verrucomicrobiota bacterium]
MNTNPLLKFMRRQRRARRASLRLTLNAKDKVEPNWLPALPGPETCGIPGFPERRSYLASRRTARTRRNAEKRRGL